MTCLQIVIHSEALVLCDVVGMLVPEFLCASTMPNRILSDAW